MAYVDEYKLLRKIGEGGCSDVWLAKDKTDHYLAIKISVEDEHEEGINLDYWDEVDALKVLDHPNVIRMIDYYEEGIYEGRRGNTRKVSYIALELADSGELFDFIFETGFFSEPVARYFFRQLWEALEYLNSKGFSHRDLKPSNMLLNNEFDLKLADFGFASSEVLNMSIKGTPSYYAPEILSEAGKLGEIERNVKKVKRNKYSGAAVDIFDAGIILFMMVSASAPFKNADKNDSHYKTIIANRPDLFWKNHCKYKPLGIDFYSSELKDLLTMMFSPNPFERPSISEIMTHPWYTDFIPDYEEIREEFTKRKQTL